MKSPFKYFRVDKNILHDPIMTTAERIGYWIQLLALAKACNCNGAFIDQFDKPMSLSQIKKTARLHETALKLFLTHHKLVQKSGEWVIVNWAKYQDNYDRRNNKQHEKTQNDSTPDNRLPITDNCNPIIDIPIPEIKKSTAQDGLNQIPKEIQIRIDKINEYHQMLQSPKYGTNQQNHFKIAIKQLESQINEINKQHGIINPLAKFL